MKKKPDPYYNANALVNYDNSNLKAKLRRFLQVMKEEHNLKGAEICRRAGIAETFFRFTLSYNLYKKQPPIGPIGELCKTFGVDPDYFLNSLRDVDGAMFLKDVELEGLTILGLQAAVNKQPNHGLFGLLVGRVAGMLSAKCKVITNLYTDKTAAIFLEVPEDHVLAGIGYFLYLHKEHRMVYIQHFRTQDDLTETGKLLDRSYVETILNKL